MFGVLRATMGHCAVVVWRRCDPGRCCLKRAMLVWFMVVGDVRQRAGTGACLGPLVVFTLCSSCLLPVSDAGPSWALRVLPCRRIDLHRWPRGWYVRSCSAAVVNSHWVIFPPIHRDRLGRQVWRFLAWRHRPRPSD